ARGTRGGPAPGEGTSPVLATRVLAAAGEEHSDAEVWEQLRGPAHPHPAAALFHIPMTGGLATAPRSALQSAHARNAAGARSPGGLGRARPRRPPRAPAVRGDGDLRGRCG